MLTRTSSKQEGWARPGPGLGPWESDERVAQARPGAQVWHGDLTAARLLYTGDGVVKLAGFGAARSRAAPTRPGPGTARHAGLKGDG